MKGPPGSHRKWGTVFFLPATHPSAPAVQSLLLSSCLEVFENHFHPIEGIDIALNVFKNMSELLSSLLVKANVPLSFIVEAIQSMHALTYKCSPNIRARLHETKLSDVRNAYVCRTLVSTDMTGGGGNDLYVRVNALKDIQSSLLR